jgi:hypothetical protein
MKTLLILNDAPYGSERTYNGARLAGALARQDVERRWNATLRMDKAAFVEHVTHGIPPPPADMDAIVRANLGL